MYTIIPATDGRILVVPLREMHRWRFTDEEGNKLKFLRANKDAVALTTGRIMVYKKPRSAAYHKEVMKHNARRQWAGLPADFDKLLDDMLEFEGYI